MHHETNSQVPAFSMDLKLTFHTNQQTTNSNHEVNISNEEKTIYILQPIKVGQQQCSLFMLQVAVIWSQDIMP